MKRALLVIVAVAASCLVSLAQPRAIGARLGGTGTQVSYEHSFGSDDFLEANLGVNPFRSEVGVNLTGIYNFIVSKPTWTTMGTWAFYAGPGVSFGSEYYKGTSNFYFGIVGQFGLEYTFDFPLQLSADFRPMVAFTDGNFYSTGLFLGLSPNISVRYVF